MKKFESRRGRTRTPRSALLALAAALCLAGCAMRSAPPDVSAPIPLQWQAALPHQGSLTDLGQWWQQHGDPLQSRNGFPDELQPFARHARQVQEQTGNVCVGPREVGDEAAGRVGRPGQEQEKNLSAYSITRSARTRKDCGNTNPIALAVFRFRTSSNLVGCSIGRSPGFAPLRILST